MKTKLLIIFVSLGLFVSIPYAFSSEPVGVLVHPPPLKQVQLEIPLHEIQCNGDRTLIWQKDTLKPACVFHESELIFDRKWAKMRIGMPAEEITQEKLCLWYADKLPKYLKPYCISESKVLQSDTKSLVVMVAPSINEEYYQEVFHDIIDYDIQTVNTIYGKDNVVLLVDKETKHLFEGKIPDDALLEANVADIWIRDFGTIDTLTEVKFDFKPQYLTNDDSVWIDDSFEDWYDQKNLSGKKSELILDGGNLVFNGKDKAITTVRVFEDNPQYDALAIDSRLKELLQVTEIAYLPEEEGDITGHSDGMVMWAESDKLLVNEYEEPFRSQVLGELEASLSGVEIIEIPYVNQNEFWRDWPSACGYYLNSLVTEDYIYVPVYGLTEDQMVLELIQSHTSKEVISIDASNVCFMVGSVRCLTWTVDGLNAEKILEH